MIEKLLEIKINVTYFLPFLALLLKLCLSMFFFFGCSQWFVGSKLVRLGSHAAIQDGGRLELNGFVFSFHRFPR